MRKEYEAFEEFTNEHPAFKDGIWFTGGWKAGDTEICLDGNFTSDQLRAIADYMDRAGLPAEKVEFSQDQSPGK